MRRRELLLGLIASACARTSRQEAKPIAATSSAVETASSPSPRMCEGVELVEWTTSGTSTHAAILRPKKVQNARFPVLVALHGRGEALKGPERGALGWPNDYALTHALERVCAPPLASADFEGLVTGAHLAEINAELAAHPWGGLVVVCPYLPDLDMRHERDVTDYGRFLAEVLLPRVARELPVSVGAVSTGIDGVSLGGAVALRAGLAHPESFGAVGALQPAIEDSRVNDLVDVARAARAKRPTLALRITTSQDDVYRDVTRALSNAWHAASVAHDFAELPGPHDYVFNRGAGAYEMLLWHARVLAR